jgi:hypothetical protein
LEIKVDNEAVPFFSADWIVGQLQKAVIFSILGGPRATGDKIFSIRCTSQREGILIQIKM